MRDIYFNNYNKSPSNILLNTEEQVSVSLPAKLPLGVLSYLTCVEIQLMSHNALVCVCMHGSKIAPSSNIVSVWCNCCTVLKSTVIYCFVSNLPRLLITSLYFRCLLFWYWLCLCSVGCTHAHCIVGIGLGDGEASF